MTEPILFAINCPDWLCITGPRYRHHEDQSLRYSKSESVEHKAARLSKAATEHEAALERQEAARLKKKREAEEALVENNRIREERSRREQEERAAREALKKRRKPWTEERRKAFSEAMRKAWARRKSA